MQLNDIVMYIGELYLQSRQKDEVIQGLSNKIKELEDGETSSVSSTTGKGTDEEVAE